MAINIAVRGTPLHSSGNTSPYTMVDAGTPANNILLVGFVCHRGSANAPSVDLAGYNLNWTLLGGIGWSAGHWLGAYAAWTGIGAANSTDPTVSFTGGTTGCHIVMCEVTGTKLTGAVVTEAFRDQGSGVFSVTASTGNAASLTINLATPAQATNNRLLAAFNHNGTDDTIERNTGGDTWTVLEEGTFTVPNSDLSVAWLSTAANNMIASGSWTSAAAGGITVEILEFNTQTAVQATATGAGVVSIPNTVVVGIPALATGNGIVSIPSQRFTAIPALATGDGLIATLPSSDISITSVTATADGAGVVATIPQVLVPVGRLGEKFALLGNFVLGEPGGGSPNINVTAVTATADGVGAMPQLRMAYGPAQATAVGVANVPLLQVNIVTNSVASALGAALNPTISARLVSTSALATGDATLGTPSSFTDVLASPAAALGTAPVSVIGAVVFSTVATATGDTPIVVMSVVLTGVPATASGEAISPPTQQILGTLFLQALTIHNLDLTVEDYFTLELQAQTHYSLDLEMV